MAVEERQIVVFTDARPEMAALVYNRLTEEGIEAFLENAALWQAVGDLPGAAIAQRVIVADVDADRAREIVAEFESESGAPRGAAEEDDSLSETSRPHTVVGTVQRGGRATDVCPACGKARLTVCPYCRTAQADFPLADQPPEGVTDNDAPLLLCSTCDEPFEAEYYRRCEWCGHDFGSGLPTESTKTVEYLNDRVTIAVMGLGLVLFAILAYFSTLLR